MWWSAERAEATGASVHPTVPMGILGSLPAGTGPARRYGRLGCVAPGYVCMVCVGMDVCMFVHMYVPVHCTHFCTKPPRSVRSSLGRAQRLPLKARGASKPRPHGTHPRLGVEKLSPRWWCRSLAAMACNPLRTRQRLRRSFSHPCTPSTTHGSQAKGLREDLHAEKQVVSRAASLALFSTVIDGRRSRR